MDPQLIALLNEDDSYLDTLSDALEDSGYRTVKGLLGARSCAMVRAARPAVVLLDFSIRQVRSGWATLQQLQEDPRTREIPIILTAAAVTPPQVAALRRRGHHWLPKPFDLGALLTLLRRVLLPAPRAASSA